MFIYQRVNFHRVYKPTYITRGHHPQGIVENSTMTQPWLSDSTWSFRRPNTRSQQVPADSWPCEHESSLDGEGNHIFFGYTISCEENNTCTMDNKIEKGWPWFESHDFMPPLPSPFWVAPVAALDSPLFPWISCPANEAREWIGPRAVSWRKVHQGRPRLR